MPTFRRMILNTMNPTPPGPPLDPYTQLADAVLRFADAMEDLLNTELTHPFTIGSDALRDCAANDSHQGTQSKQALTTLATAQIRAGYVQCDLHRAVAACLREPKVFFAPFPLARTNVVVAAKAWFVLDASSLEERLQRYLNEELAALHDAPLDTDDEEARKYVEERTNDYLAIGATAGLHVSRRKQRKRWGAPFLVRSDEQDTQTPSSETQLVRSVFEASGFGGSFYAGLPYSLMSAATHGRFHRAGVTAYTPVGPSEGGVVESAFHARVDVTAQVTVHAAFATLTYLCALARYTKVSEEVVRERLRDPLAQWCATGGVPLPA